MSFAKLKHLIHRNLKLQPNQEVSQIIYRMPYGRNLVNFLSADVSDDEQVEADGYIPQFEFNRSGDQECGTSQAFGEDDINEDGLEMVEEMMNMPIAEPNE
ncbi:uncharacterized protein G2W53_000978 [Senna tora]|uniref:Uncharacterized protein n=1 Tax=Senna tora TaxID=362788 RepID=A0A834XF22_9FABA|nr:uncharacterized protein G2W53_000978 [Senna tora]